MQDLQIALIRPARVKASLKTDPLGLIRSNMGVYPIQTLTHQLLGRIAIKDNMFPGGWFSNADKLKDGVTVQLFKYVEKGSTSEMRYDGFIHLNGSWKWFQKYGGHLDSFRT